MNFLSTGLNHKIATERQTQLSYQELDSGVSKYGGYPESTFRVRDKHTDNVDIRMMLVEY